MKVTIVIPNYNGIHFLKDCLEALRDQMGNARVLVVDNGSTDGSSDYVRECFPKVDILQLGHNTGFCGAVNAGISASKTPYIILLNNDTIVRLGFVEALVNTMEQSEQIFSASAKMLCMKEPDRIDDAGDCYCALGWAYARGKGKKAENYETQVNVFASCGGAAIYRRSVLDKIGVFDMQHFAYLEDIDLGYRARIYGYRNVFCPKAEVLHAGSGFSGSRYNEFKVSLSSANSVYLIWKNMPFLQWILNLPFLIIGYMTKTLFFCKKGLGVVYIKGCIKGLKKSFSKGGRAAKVPFMWKNLLHYGKIQLELWINLFRIIR